MLNFIVTLRRDQLVECVVGHLEALAIIGHVAIVVILQFECLTWSICRKMRIAGKLRRVVSILELIRGPVQLLVGIRRRQCCDVVDCVEPEYLVVNLEW